MADNTPVFKPPMDTRVIDNDPQISRVPLDKVDFAARKSQQAPMKNDFPIKHIQNGR